MPAMQGAETYINVMPSMNGYFKRVSAEVKRNRVTQHVDVEFDQRQLKKAKSDLDTAAKSAADARRRESAATREAVTAERQLQALRNKGITDASRLAAAEDKVAKAKTNSRAAANALNAAESQRSTAGARVTRIEAKLDSRRAEADSETLLQRITSKFERGGQEAGSKFAGGVSAAMNSHSRGNDEGRSFAAGFISALGSGMRMAAVGFTLVNDGARSVIRNVGMVATGVGLAARALKVFSAGLLVSSSLLRVMTGAGIARLAGVLRLAAAAAGILARDIARVTSALLLMAAAARLVGILTRVGKALGMVTVGSAVALGAMSALGSVVSSFVTGPLVAGLTAVAGAMGTVAAAAAGILGPAIGVAKMAFAGLSAGAKAWDKSQNAVGASATKGASALKAIESAKKSQARTAEQGARQIVSAEKQVVKAQKDVKEAQDEVNKARQEAKRDAEGYARTLAGLALDEESASLALAEAKKTLRETKADPDADSLDMWRANLGVREAQQAYDEIKASNAQQRGEIADAQAKGIEGSDRVVEAKQREVDAQEQLQEAQSDLAQTQKDVAQANIDAAEAVADAYESMAESQQSAASGDDPFAAMIGQRLAPLLQALKNLREEITDRFSGAMSGAFVKLGGLLDHLKPSLGGLATTLGNLGSQIVSSISSPAALAGWDRMIDGSNRFFQSLSQGENGIGSVFSGLIQVLGTAAQTFADSGAGINAWLLDLGEKLRNISADDLRGTFDSVRQIFQNISVIAGPLFDLFRGFGSEAASGLAPGFSAMGQAIQDSIPGLMDMARELMPALGQALVNLAPVLPGLVDAFSPWADILALVAPHLATVIEKLVPFAPLLLGIITAVKLMGVAVTVWNGIMFAASVAQGIFAAATGRSSLSLAGNTIALAAHRVALIAGAVAQGAWNAVTNLGIIAAARTAAGFIASRVAMLASSAATGIAAAAQWALNAAMTANPIGIVIAVLAGLVAAVVLAYKNSETFRGIVQAAWQGIQDAVSFAWNNIISPVLGFFGDKIGEVGRVVSFFYDNVVKPYFELVGTVISTVVDGAKRAFSAFTDALGSVGNFFSSTVEGIDNKWSSLRGLLAKPINFMINTVWNDGILKAWNMASGLLGMEPTSRLPSIPEHATGGRIKGPGTGTSDDVLMWGSNSEHMVTAKEVERAGGHNVVYAIRDMIMRGVPFTWDGGNLIREMGRDNLNAYGAQVAAKGLGNVDPQGMFDWLLPKYKDGGEVRAGAPWEKALENGHRAAKMRNGNPYTWGFEDCSGYMSAIADAILNGGDGKWTWATGSFPNGQPFVPGLGKGFSVGVHDNPGGPGGGHTAGTLTGIGQYATTNVESGGAHNYVAYGGPAAGADSSQFVGVRPGQYHLAIGPDGSFESAGPGGGGGPSPDQKRSFLQSKIADTFDWVLNPIKDGIAAAIGTPPPEALGIPTSFLNKGRDMTAGYLADKTLDLGDMLSSAWDKAKDFALFRDTGGWIPNGLSVVRNETGKPEAVLNWDQLQMIRDVLGRIGFGNTDKVAEPGQDPGPVDWGGVGAQIGTSLLAEWGNDLLGMAGISKQFEGMKLVDEYGRRSDQAGDRNEASFNDTPTSPEESAPAPTGGTTPPTAPQPPAQVTPASPAAPMTVVDKVKAAFKPYGWDSGEQWAAADWIIGKESSWNPLARNPSSGAFSLFQFLGSTKDQYLPDENPDPYIQGQAGAKYIKDRYGDPMAAKSFWEKNNWYDQGGLAFGKGFMLKNVIHPERVLSPRQTEAFEELAPMLNRLQLATTAPGDVMPESARSALELAPMRGGPTYNITGRVDRETMSEVGIHERQSSRTYGSRNR
ncbi:hypothetical protein QM716_15695 [Rhodococcus sp. IEGM 1409]|uniref:aggregation-promoting factor C-terminal-like domain-containing protein n=1 Tax=Rhodococcus sp. IEGM 1409 TaxID=3047082 RepID=UPI0024B75BFA|nr:hypothetical protein [Rhodococcus sp. IEGM 1409]MDI9901302.1 hypothetical protein [Rhodococcus sp. IEGM 1409]